MRIAKLYSFNVIRDFLHKGLEQFFRTGRKAGIQPVHAKRLVLQLGALNAAIGPNGMNMPGWKLHPLKGDLDGHWAVWVDKNWRLTFRFDGIDTVMVDYRDYH